jgi:hypothetical protein
MSAIGAEYLNSLQPLLPVQRLQVNNLLLATAEAIWGRRRLQLLRKLQEFPHVTLPSYGIGMRGARLPAASMTSPRNTYLFDEDLLGFIIYLTELA